jgi:conjugal transfer pilus assembly protein TraF
MRVITALFLLTSMINVSAELLADTNIKSAPSYYVDRERGWFWYEDPMEDSEEEKIEKETSMAVPAPAILSPREMLKKQGEQWENALGSAILNPTRENYQEYLKLTAQIQQQAQDFSTGFKQAIWVSPEYDFALQKPRTTQAIIAQNQDNMKVNEQELYRVAQKNGIIFFFRGDCPYCHRFAPILKRFSQLYGFTVIPVSLDGDGLPEYPYPKPNYDIGTKLKVSVVPAIFMVNPETNAVSTVGYGFSDSSELMAKVLFAAKQLEAKLVVKDEDVL